MFSQLFLGWISSLGCSRTMTAGCGLSNLYTAQDFWILGNGAVSRKGGRRFWHLWAHSVLVLSLGYGVGGDYGIVGPTPLVPHSG